MVRTWCLLRTLIQSLTLMIIVLSNFNNNNTKTRTRGYALRRVYQDHLRRQAPLGRVPRKRLRGLQGGGELDGGHGSVQGHGRATLHRATPQTSTHGYVSVSTAACLGYRTLILNLDSHYSILIFKCKTCYRIRVFLARKSKFNRPPGSERDFGSSSGPK